MVVDFLSMSNRNFAIPDLCSLISLNLTLALNHIHGDECQIANALIAEPIGTDMSASIYK
jgi:hypothetical protein